MKARRDGGVTGGSGDRTVERVGEERRHGRPHEEVPQELRDRVPRFGHGSRVPGWDESVDLDKPPQEIPDLATTRVPDELRIELEGHLAKYPDRRSAAIPCLAAAQRRHGWCSPEAITQVAAVMRLTPAYLVSVASFYDMLDTRPIGRHRIYVCTNISCSLNGGRQLNDRIRAQVGDGDPDIQVRGFECLGACDMAPMASVDGIYVGPIELDEVPELVEQVRAGRPPLPAKQLRRRLSADPHANTREWPRVDDDELSADREPHTPVPQQPVRHPDSGQAGAMPGDKLGPSAPLEQAPDPPAGPTPKS